MSENCDSCEPTGAGDSNTCDWKQTLRKVFRTAWIQKEGRLALGEMVKTYLTKTKEGRQLVWAILHTDLRSLLPQGESRPGEDLLVVMSPDGWIEVYGHRGVRPHFYTKPPFGITVADRLKSELLLEEQLPQRLRELYWPHATGTKPGLLASCQVRLAQPGGAPVFTWMICDNQWPSDDNIAGLCDETLTAPLSPDSSTDHPPQRK